MHYGPKEGDGNIIGSCDSGVCTGGVESQAYGRDIHYLRYVGNE